MMIAILNWNRRNFLL